MPTDTPTVEQMVRKIAEWMGLELQPNEKEGSCFYRLKNENIYFWPHMCAESRERVFREVGKRYGREGVWAIINGWLDQKDELSGLAFVTAVYQWIVSQEKNMKQDNTITGIDGHETDLTGEE